MGFGKGPPGSTTDKKCKQAKYKFRAGTGHENLQQEVLPCNLQPNFKSALYRVYPMYSEKRDWLGLGTYLH